MTLYYSTFYYPSRFRWEFEVPWRFFALLFDFWWVKRPLGWNSKLRFPIFLRLIYNFEIQFHKIEFQQISKVFCHNTFKLKSFQQDIRFFSPFAFKPIESRLYILSAFWFNIYLVVIGLGRLPTIRYAPVFDENQIPLENRIRERQL